MVHRCVVCLLILPGLLLTHLGGLRHSHGAHQNPGHDLFPHVHTGSQPPSHGHHHHHDDEEDGADSTSGTIPEPVTPPSDHDSDAVYTSVPEAVPEGRFNFDARSFGAEWFFAPYLGRAGFLGDEIDFDSFFWPHPPPLGDHGLRLFIRHLALLI